MAVGAVVALAVMTGIVVIALKASPSPTPVPAPSPSPTDSPSPSPSPTPVPTPSPSPTDSPVAACPMNGEALADPGLAERIPIIVQIENNPTARPPTGLNLADLVIEAPVEGDTTRFSAVFMCDPVVGVSVGPVRSVRYFNIDLWQQLRGLTLHFGGAYKVLHRFDQAGMPYANGLTGGWRFFYRTGPWPAPHNVYLDVDAAREAMDDGPLTNLAGAVGQPIGAPFTFATDARPPAGRDVESVEIWTSSAWHFGWHWDESDGVWLRTDGGAPNFEGSDGGRLSAGVVIVQRVRQDVLIGENDPGGYPRRYQYLVDDGTGVLYIDGQAHDVEWSRPTADDLTTWTYADSGEPVILPPGKVWWEIVPIGSSLVED